MKLQKLSRLIEEVRQVDEDMPTSTLYALLVVAEHDPEPVNMRKLSELVGISPAAISRTCDRLGSRGAGGKAGLSFTKDERDPDNQRISLVTLTAAGRAWVQKLNNMIER